MVSTTAGHRDTSVGVGDISVNVPLLQYGYLDEPLTLSHHHKSMHA